MSNVLDLPTERVRVTEEKLVHVFSGVFLWGVSPLVFCVAYGVTREFDV